MAQNTNPVAKIRKLDEVVVNRIAAGEVIQRPANALKELIENSLDAKATNIQILAKEGGLKLLQIQDNGTGIRKEDMDIVCERFTTSKLQKFEDLNSISTFGFRGEALASISHVALLSITTKTADEKCAYKGSYIDSKLKAPVKSCAGNQGTVITIENLFYNVATRRKALSSPADEFAKITDVVMKYAVHNPSVGFVLKKHGEMTPQVRTPHNSTKMNNARILYGNPVSRELLEVELNDESYQFKLHALITNPNYSNKRMVLLLFINNRLVDSSNIRKMLEDLYIIYLPKKTHPWCYISLQINPENIDVNVHPTKHEVKFLHEDMIIERVKNALDEKLSGNSASRTFYLQARLPNADVTKEVLEEVLPEYEKSSGDKSKKLYAKEMIRTDFSDQKLDKFNFTIHSAMKHSRNDSIESIPIVINQSSLDQVIPVININNTTPENEKMGGKNRSETINEKTAKSPGNFSDILNDPSPSISSETTQPSVPDFVTSTQNDKLYDALESDNYQDILDTIRNEFPESPANGIVSEPSVDEIANEARKKVHKIFGTQDANDVEIVKEINNKNVVVSETSTDKKDEKPLENVVGNEEKITTPSTSQLDTTKSSSGFKSYSVNNFRREVKLTSVLKLRKEVENDCHTGLRQILSELTFVGCIDETRALIQSGVNLYLCNTKNLAEEFFYEIMLYDFANYGVIKFSDAVSLYELALLGLETEEAGWTEEDGSKSELAKSVKELLLEKADMMKEYFSIVIDKRGNLKSLPILLDKYFPCEGGLPLFILRLATEVDWSTEQPCFRNVCRETAKYYSEMNAMHNTHDWKYITEHVLYPAIKESFLPPKHFAHNSTILQIASLPELYKVFERC